MACTFSAVTRKSRASLISRASTSPAEYGVCTAGGLKRKSPKRILRSGAFANSLRWFAHWQTVRFHAQKKKASVWAGYFIFKVVGRKPLISIDWLWSTKLIADAPFALGLAYRANGDDRAAQTTYAQGIRLFGAEDAQQIGALQSLDALIKNSEENIVAREIRMTYWP
jgi:hypothetical protein